MIEVVGCSMIEDMQFLDEFQTQEGSYIESSQRETETDRRRDRERKARGNSMSWTNLAGETRLAFGDIGAYEFRVVL